jgi:NhaP-type Na+/H+ or K+/H+ antiporter
MAALVILITLVVQAIAATIPFPVLARGEPEEAAAVSRKEIQREAAAAAAAVATVTAALELELDQTR